MGPPTTLPFPDYFPRISAIPPPPPEFFAIVIGGRRRQNVARVTLKGVVSVVLVSHVE